jgi:hypothetical protein
MPTPDINLGIGEILIIESGSVLGITPLDANLNFGVVQLVYDSCDNFEAGNTIMFDKRNGQAFLYGSTVYLKIKQEHLSGKEITPP